MLRGIGATGVDEFNEKSAQRAKLMTQKPCLAERLFVPYSYARDARRL
jgi:hypothetical protein